MSEQTPIKTTVIHHSADYDGIFCREIAKKFLPDAELIGWDFSDPPLMTAHPGFNQRIYVMDLPIDKPFGLDARNLPPWVFESVIWIDHHKSSIESHPKDIHGYRIDGVAACRLAWQYFTATESHEPVMNSPTKQDFIDRNVSEPLAVRLVGEYDIWDKRDPRAETFQYGLRLMNESENVSWNSLLKLNQKTSVEQIEELMGVGHNELLNPDGMTDNPSVLFLLQQGCVAQRYQQKLDSDLVTYRSYRVKWEGLDFLVLNTGRFNSLTFAALDTPETGHDALLGWRFDGKQFTVSLYHANHRKDLDLSQIAVKHGGGGHRGACGFTCQNLPF